MRRVLHWFAHLLRCNCGRPESRWTAEGHLVVGFRCHSCGRLSDESCGQGCPCRAYRHYS